MHQISAYGLWSLVILNSLVFIIFAFSFTKPKSLAFIWRVFGVHRGSLHRNVWVPADYLFALRLAADSIPETTGLRGSTIGELLLPAMARLTSALKGHSGAF